MFKDKVKSVVNKVKSCFSVTRAVVTAKAHEVLDGTAGEAYVDTGVKVLIAVVVGGLLLTLLYTLFSDTIAPNVEERVNEIFTYGGLF